MAEENNNLCGNTYTAEYSPTEPCEQVSTDCVTYEGSLPELSLDNNSALTSIINAIVSSLMNLSSLQQSNFTTYTNINLAPETIGGFLQGEPITPPEGLNIVQVFDKLFNGLVQPTVSFNVNNQIIEVGSDFNQSINITFTQNDAGQVIAYSLVKNGSEISATQSTAFSETNITNSFTLQAFASYSAGEDILQGTAVTPLITISPKYKYWVYSGSSNTSPTVSTSIRALTTNGFVPANSVSVVIPQGNTEVSIYLKQTSTLQSVIYVESSNADITANFTETLVTVNDANGTPVQYKKLTQTIGGTGYTANATYLITITE